MMNELWLRSTHYLRKLLKKRQDNQEGQGLVEYALILALIAIFVVVALKFLQVPISSTLNQVANGI
jgi:pilus assembly protein Flp/PilA